ncbi:MAG TPA: hypothetical protein VGG61_01325 [Gemmataceae bacterium]
MLTEADIAWKNLPRAKRKQLDHWRWITKRVRRRSQGVFKIEPTWAKGELTKERG